MQNIIVSGNMGKSVFSFYLTKALCKKGKKVVIISTDIECSPAFALLFANNDKSMGKLLEKPFITKQEVFSQMNFVYDNFSYLCYANSETPNSYPKVVEENCQRLFDILNDIADFVILDSKYSFGKIETAFRKQEDLTEFIVCPADRRGVAYRNAFQNDNHSVHILTEISPYNNVSEICATYRHKPKYILPYCKTFGAIFSAAKITDIPAPKPYLKVINRIAREEFGC